MNPVTVAGQPLYVGLLWHSITSDNLGVGALTVGQMAIVTEAARRLGRPVRFIVVGTRGGTPYPIDAFVIDSTAEFALRAFKRLDFQAIAQLRRCDIVLDIGEGDSFADIYGNKRLAIQVLGKLVARVFGKPLVLSPQTIGPFKSGLGRTLSGLGMRLATRIYARDHLSMRYLEERGHAHHAQEVIDVAFALPFQRPERAPGGPVRIGINVSGLMHGGGYSGKNEFRLTVDYPQLIEKTCRHFLALPGTEVYLVPHVISDAYASEDDLRASQGLVERIPGLRLAPRFRAPSEAKSFISGMDFFTGARMHACIAAFSSGVPVVPMAYSRKFNGLFNSLQYTHLVDCLQLSTDAAFERLCTAFEQRATLAAEVQRGNALAQAKVETYTTQLSSLLQR